MCGFVTATGVWAEGCGEGLRAVACRGPDARGVWRDPEDPSLVMGHHRLSVRDLSAAGAQPMASADGRHVLVYNGEVYNAEALREELERGGGAPAGGFRGGSDTEVLLAALVAWGLEETLRKLDGIFAFVWLDRRERTLMGARDRFGVKPLFTAAGDGGFAAGSTVDALLHLPGLDRRLDPHALREYLAWGAIPSPMTIVRGVQATPPGSWWRYHLDRHEITGKRWWFVPEADPGLAGGSADELVEVVDGALDAAVRSQLVSDVPVGAFLSGGIDSSLIVSRMAKAGANPVRTYCMKFGEAKGYDESVAARAVAERFGCEHHEMDSGELDGAAWASSIAELDQPLADPAYTALRTLCGWTREHVPVALSGDGADELFGGYGRFVELAHQRPAGVAKRWGQVLVRSGVLPGSLLRRTLFGPDLLLWQRSWFGPFPRTRKDLTPLVRADVLKNMGVEQSLGLWLGFAAGFDPELGTDALMRADLWTYLSENCLVKTDRASMAVGLEARVPMLSGPLVDAVLPWGAEAKVGPRLKHALRTLAERELPREVWDRPKHGFSVPLRAKLSGAWEGVADGWLDQAEDLAPWLNGPAVRTRVAAARRGQADARQAYALVALLGWLAEHRLSV